MKKNILYILLGMALMTSSCDVLDKTPLDEIGNTAFWQDENLVQYYVNDLYNEIYVDDEHLEENRTDNAVSAQRDKWRAWAFMFNYNALSPSDPNVDIWSDYYAKIRKCNRFFEQIGNTTLSEEKIKVLTGQVYFMRALFYFDLVKHYGGVVLLDKVLTMEDDWNLPRATEEATYNFILADLQKAIDLLPEEWDSDNKGRVTKGAAYAFRSRVNLYAKKYQECIKDCETVKGMNRYELVDGKTPEGYRSIWWQTNKDNKEIIFDLQFKGPDVTNHMMVYNLVAYLNDPYGDRGWSGICPTQELIDEYEMADGTPAVKYSNADPERVFNVNETGIYKGREPRFYGSIVTHGNYIFLKGDKGPARVDRFLLDRPEKSDASLTGYSIWKWIDYDNYNYPYGGASSPDFPTNWILFRYAEIFLNEAEARLETDDVNGALQAINVIRSRVGLPILTETNQNKLRELIRKERRIELAFEDQRFWDVRRWRIGDKTQRTLHGVIWVSDTEFKVMTADVRKWDNRLYLYPIPHDEILRQSALEQNPNY